MENLKTIKNESACLQSSVSIGNWIVSKKKYGVYSLLMLLFLFFSIPEINAQEADKEIKVKVVKIINGEVIIDEEIVSKEDIDVDKLLKDLNFDDDNIDISKNGEKTIQKQVIVIATDGEDLKQSINLEELYKSLPKDCKKDIKKYCKKYCKDLSKCNIGSMIKYCKMDSAKYCKISYFCIVKCVANADGNTQLKCTKKQAKYSKNGKKKSDQGVTTDYPDPHRRLPIENINFFPNPNNGQFTLNFNMTGEDNSDGLITIQDISGKTVYKEKLKDFSGNYNKQIDLSDASKGIYILNIKEGANSHSEKIMVE